MSRQGWIVSGFLLVVALLIGAGWLVRDRFLPVEVGSRAPDFTARDLEGRPVSLSDLSGEVILLNVWATWCEPCREEMPSMQRLHEQMARRGLRVVAVSVDGSSLGERVIGDPVRVVADFARELDLAFTIWHDPAGEVQRRYRTTALPESFVIDRNGVIVKKVIGATAWDSEANVELFDRLLER